MLETLAILDALILLGIAVFQVLLAAGKPWGEYAWGGGNPGVLPRRLRRSSAVSAVIQLAAAVVVLIEGGVLFETLQSTATEIVVWALAAFLLLGTVMNAISRSKKERNKWTPVAAAAFVLTALVAWLG